MSDKLTFMDLQPRAKGIALVCSCCFHATAYVQNGRLVITGRHGSQIHTNVMTAEDLEKLAQIVRVSGTMPANKVA